MFIKRLVSSCILIPIVISILFLSSSTQFAFFLCIVSLISAWEWGKIMQFSFRIFRIWMYTVFGLLCMITIMLQTKYYISYNLKYIIWLFFVIFVISWILSFFLTLCYPKFSVFWSQSNVLRFYFGILIIIPFFWSTLILRNFHYIDGDIVGIHWLSYVIILVWINDVSAYLIGQTFGRHKLLQYVSPGKTLEGFIGGILVSLGISYLFNLYITIIINNYLILIYSISISIMAIIGDLVESMFKREAGMKDSGNLIPGHGGILDRIDSLSVIIPVSTCLIFLYIY